MLNPLVAAAFDVHSEMHFEKFVKNVEWGWKGR